MSSRKEDVAKKKALSKMGGDKEEFLKFLKLQRQGVYMVSVLLLLYQYDWYVYCRRSILLIRKCLMKLNNSDWRNARTSAE